MSLLALATTAPPTRQTGKTKNMSSLALATTAPPTRPTGRVNKEYVIIIFSHYSTTHVTACVVEYRSPENYWSVT